MRLFKFSLSLFENSKQANYMFDNRTYPIYYEDDITGFCSRDTLLVQAIIPVATPFGLMIDSEQSLAITLIWDQGKNQFQALINKKDGEYKHGEYPEQLQLYANGFIST